MATLLDFLMSPPYSAYQEMWKKNDEEYGKLSPAEKAKKTWLQFGGAFGGDPDTMKIFEKSGTGGAPKGNYWNEVIGDLVQGTGHYPSIEKYLPSVSEAPGVHSEVNAVSEAADLVRRDPAALGALQEAGYGKPEDYYGTELKPKHLDELLPLMSQMKGLYENAYSDMPQGSGLDQNAFVGSGRGVNERNTPLFGALAMLRDYWKWGR